MSMLVCLQGKVLFCVNVLKAMKIVLDEQKSTAAFSAMWSPEPPKDPTVGGRVFLSDFQRILLKKEISREICASEIAEKPSMAHGCGQSGSKWSETPRKRPEKPRDGGPQIILRTPKSRDKQEHL